MGLSIRHVVLCSFFGLFISYSGGIAQTFPMPIPPADGTKSSSDPAVKAPEFDVASVKEDKSADGGMEWRSTDDGFSAKNLSLKGLISTAYNINSDLISGGPSWVDSTGYDLNAKVSGEDVAALQKLTGEQRNVMLQPVLADRFKLKVHFETKMLPIYDLEIAKNGPKLATSSAPKFDKNKPRDPAVKYAGTMMTRPGSFTAYGTEVSVLAGQLAYIIGHPVIDKTGLTGIYDFDLKYAKPEEQGGSGKTDNGSAEQAPSIFTALQEQLGLKLQSTKGPVKTLVIDHVEKPAEN